MFNVNAHRPGYFYNLFCDIARSFRSHPRRGVRSQLVLKSYSDLLVRLIFIRSSHQRPQIKGQRTIGALFAISKLAVLRTKSSSTAKSACSSAACSPGSQALRREVDSVWSLESLTLTAAAESTIVTRIDPMAPASREKFTVQRFAAGGRCAGRYPDFLHYLRLLQRLGKTADRKTTRRRGRECAGLRLGHRGHFSAPEPVIEKKNAWETSVFFREIAYQ